MTPRASLDQISMTKSLSSFTHTASCERAISCLSLLERGWENIVFSSRWPVRDLSPDVYVTCSSFVDRNWWARVSSPSSSRGGRWCRCLRSVARAPLCVALFRNARLETMRFRHESHCQAVIFTCERRCLGTGCCCRGCIGIPETAPASQAIYKHYWRGGRTPSGTTACGVECRRAWRCALCHSLMFRKYARLSVP